MVWKRPEKQRANATVKRMFAQSEEFHHLEGGHGDGLAHQIDWGKNKPQGATGSVKFWHGDFLSPGRWLSENCMDAIFCRGAHHWIADRDTSIEEQAIGRMIDYVKPGGKVVVEFQKSDDYPQVYGRERIESMQRACKGRATLAIYRIKRMHGPESGLGRYQYEYLAEITKHPQAR
jgi:hypothetical protein